MKLEEGKPFIDVFNEEIENWIKKRRIDNEKRVEQLVEAEGGEYSPKVKYKLVGLAISGGGIRSATYALGVLQRAAKAGVLKFVDYLSTASGGGYLGACWSSLKCQRGLA